MLLPKTQVHFQAHGVANNPVTPFPKVPVLSPNLCRHCLHITYIYMRAKHRKNNLKTLYRLKTGSPYTDLTDLELTMQTRLASNPLLCL